MKKYLLSFLLLSSISAAAAQYADGTYRGLYISKQETEVEVQFDLKDDVITKATYRALHYKGNDWLKDPEYVAKNGGYIKLLDDYDEKFVFDVRKHISWYLKGLENSTEAKRKINQIDDYDEIIRLLEGLY